MAKYKKCTNMKLARSKYDAKKPHSSLSLLSAIGAHLCGGAAYKVLKAL